MEVNIIMLTLEKLKEFGADTESGMNRCMNNEEFYIMLVNSVLPDNRLEQLERAVTDRDLDKAFEIAHALKGMYGNISLTPIYEPISQMTELLRSRTDTDYMPYILEAAAQKQRLEELGKQAI